MSWRKFQKLTLDDIFHGLAFLFLLTSGIVWSVYVQMIEREANEQPNAAAKAIAFDVPTRLRYGFSILALYWGIVYSVKASFLALYWRLFSISIRFRTAWGCVVAFVGISGLITIFSNLWYCGSPSNLMDPGRALNRP